MAFPKRSAPSLPWVETLDFYEGKEALTHVPGWVERVRSRDAYQRGAAENGF